jgi:SAM-dependent methyltransferase
VPRWDNGFVAESWMIDELAHAGPEHLDPAFVAGYDRKQGYPDPAEDLAAFAAHGLGPASTVVDLGAGTGQFALAAARRFGHVTAVDVAPAMVATLRERSAAAGLDNLECVRAGFLSYQHSGSPADGVYTRHALHQPTVTQPRTTPSTSVPSSVPSGGCSSRCSPQPASSSST